MWLRWFFFSLLSAITARVCYSNLIILLHEMSNFISYLKILLSKS